MRKHQKEKAPEGTANSETGAKKFVQHHNNPDFENCQEPIYPVIPEMISMAKRMVELNNIVGIIGLNFDEPRVLIGDKFFDLFDFGEYDEDRIPGYTYYFTTVDGVEFCCMEKKEAE